MIPGSNAGPATSIAGKRVSQTAPTDGQALVYQAAGGLWLPGATGTEPDDPAAVSMLASLAAEVTLLGAGPANFINYSLPAGTLGTDGDTLDLWLVWSRGTGAGGQWAKFEVKFGGLSAYASSQIVDATPNNTVVANIHFQRRGASSLGIYGEVTELVGGVATVFQLNTSIAPTLANANAIVVEQTSQGNTANDSTLRAFSLIRTNAP